jgi:hypothetical protein
MVSGPGAAIAAAPSTPRGIIGCAGVHATGVAMRVAGDGEHFHLVVLDGGNAPLLVLGPFTDEDVVAEWRRLAAASGLSAKIQLPNGSVLNPYPQVGRVLLGSTRQRRRHGLLARRRPRFLTRRKTGRFPLRPQVHRETELAGGEPR